MATGRAQQAYNELHGLEEGVIANINRTIMAGTTMNFASMVSLQMGAALGVYVSKLTGSADYILAGISNSTFQRANYVIGLQAQDATARAYANRRPRRRVGSYRVGSGRYAGQALLRAIKAPDFFRATPQGIQFINVERLNREARQWKRLNFGAGGGAVRPPGQFGVEFNGLLAATLGLTPDPRPGFKLPPGFWLGADGVVQRRGTPGTGRFFPVGGPQKYATYGIVGTNFLDAGVRRIAQAIGPTYYGLFQGHLQEALDKAFAAKAPQVDFKVPTFRVTGVRRGAPGRIAMPDISAETQALYNRNRAIYKGIGRPEATNPSIRPGGVFGGSEYGPAF